MYEKFSRASAERVEAGDICAVCGISDIQVSFCSLHPTSLGYIIYCFT